MCQPRQIVPGWQPRGEPPSHTGPGSALQAPGSGLASALSTSTWLGFIAGASRVITEFCKCSRCPINAHFECCHR